MQPLASPSPSPQSQKCRCPKPRKKKSEPKPRETCKRYIVTQRRIGRTISGTKEVPC